MGIHTNPGVYALLLGSGISRTAGIPTGWDVTLDLIQKLAIMRKEDLGPDLAKWYEQTYSEPPDYSKLLDKLTTSPEERRAILNNYFEPSDDEREQNLKQPTAAHRAIAKLVRLGCIRMILTTNFDRLLEHALEDEGIVPDVISTDDGLNGAVPYVHSKCVIVKLHGDYRDPRIKNTPDELATYSQTLNSFLDRVFDEFGLVVCGWSAAYDTALRNAILRCPTRRFTTFWFARGDLNDDAKRVADQRRALVVQINGADQVFSALLEHVESLRELEKPSQLSVQVTVASVKRYLAEPNKHRIRLYDLINDETESVYQTLTSDKYDRRTNPLKSETFAARLKDYEVLVERLARMMATVAFYDLGENAYLLTKVIERLVSFLEPYDYAIQLYPALLIEYVSGLAALAGKRAQSLAAILNKPTCDSRYKQGKIAAIERLHVWGVFDGWDKMVPRENAAREFTPANNYLSDALRPFVQDYLPDNRNYELQFDLFEGLLMFVYIDLRQESQGIPPYGSFSWRYRNNVQWDEGKWRDLPYIKPLLPDAKDGIGAELIRVGFFEGSAERAAKLMEEGTMKLRRITNGWL
jgi:hypothetical protein